MSSMSILLGILLISFIIHATAVVPFIALLYRVKFFKKKPAVTANKPDPASTHIRPKSRPPEGGGLLIIVITSLIFAALLPLFTRLGVNITHVYPIAEA